MYLCNWPVSNEVRIIQPRRLKLGTLIENLTKWNTTEPNFYHFSSKVNENTLTDKVGKF